MMEKLFETLKQNPALARITNKVKVSHKEKYSSQVKVGKHKFIFDEDTAIGGTDLGPSPANTLLAAIGGCEVTTGYFWARRMGLKIENIEVRLKGTFDVRGLLGISEVNPGYQSIECKIKITSSEPAEKITELAQKIKKHCPVLNTLIASPELKFSHEHIAP